MRASPASRAAGASADDETSLHAGYNKGKVYHPGEAAHGVGQEMYCKAHESGARVLTWGYGGWSGAHFVSMMKT